MVKTLCSNRTHFAFQKTPRGSRRSQRAGSKFPRSDVTNTQETLTSRGLSGSIMVSNEESLSSLPCNVHNIDHNLMSKFSTLERSPGKASPKSGARMTTVTTEYSTKGSESGSVQHLGGGSPEHHASEVYLPQFHPQIQAVQFLNGA